MTRDVVFAGHRGRVQVQEIPKFPALFELQAVIAQPSEVFTIRDHAVDPGAKGAQALWIEETGLDEDAGILDRLRIGLTGEAIRFGLRCQVGTLGQTRGSFAAEQVRMLWREGGEAFHGLALRKVRVFSRHHNLPNSASASVERAMKSRVTDSSSGFWATAATKPSSSLGFVASVLPALELLSCSRRWPLGRPPSRRRRWLDQTAPLKPQAPSFRIWWTDLVSFPGRRVC
jgi:hypothetical protein